MRYLIADERSINLKLAPWKIRPVAWPTHIYKYKVVIYFKIIKSEKGCVTRTIY